MQLQDDLIDRFGNFPDEVADLLTIGLIKYYGEYALIENIRRRDDEVEITFSKEGTKTLPGEETFRALSEVPLKANVAAAKDQLKVTLRLEKDYLKSIYKWLGHIEKFVQHIAEYRIKEKEQDN